jgi:hypothetical protein
VNDRLYVTASHASRRCVFDPLVHGGKKFRNVAVADHHPLGVPVEPEV